MVPEACGERRGPVVGERGLEYPKAGVPASRLLDLTFLFRETEKG
jgi:hypothetical protein